VWNPDLPQPIDFHDGWLKVPEQRDYDNAFKAEWELFLRHVALDEPFHDRVTQREGSFEKTLAQVIRLRQREGRETAARLRTHIRVIRGSALRIEQRFRKQPARIENKLKQRIRDLNRSPFLTEERLAEEAAFLTQRYGDVLIRALIR